MNISHRRYSLISLVIVSLAVIAALFADLEVYNVEPWLELTRILNGFLAPDFSALTFILPALAQTIAFALLAVCGSALLGMLLALVFHYRWVRVICASTRAVHELFWALIFMQVFGLSAITGILAILIPYTGTFAKVYCEIFSQQPKGILRTISTKSSSLSRVFYTLIPMSWSALSSYTRYRFECALRSSAVLGFIGLPTLGFFLETAFKQGQYAQSAMILIVFYVLIASVRYWLRRRLIPLYILAAFWLLPDIPSSQASLWLFISQDIWPSAVRHGQWLNAVAWYWQQLTDVALPAMVDTLVLSQIALALTGAVALISYGISTRKLIKNGWHRFGQGFLVVLRSTPEMIFAFVFLLFWGPSFLPAIAALSLHNGGLIGFLLASQSEHLKLRVDAPKGLNLYFYELTPRLYAAFLSFLLYRWEVIIRESAILGILGITTIGFYVDSAFEDIRYDRAMFLIVISALVNIAVDSASRRVQKFCALQKSFV